MPATEKTEGAKLMRYSDFEQRKMDAEYGLRLDAMRERAKLQAREAAARDAIAKDGSPTADERK